MDRFRIAEYELRMQHRHDDGTWSTLERRPAPHDPAEDDPEREWADGVIYACTTCDELVRVAPPEGEKLPL